MTRPPIALTAPALLLVGCDGLFVTKLNFPPDASLFPVRPAVTDAGSAPPPLAMADAALVEPDSAMRDAGAPEAAPFPEDAGDLSVSLPADDAGYVAPPDERCFLASDRDLPDPPGGHCPPRACVPLYRARDLVSGSVGLTCRNDPSDSYCSAEDVRLVAERERIAFGSPLPHRSLYELTLGDTHLELEFDAAVLEDASITSLVRNVLRVSGYAGSADAGRLDFDCPISSTAFAQLSAGVLHGWTVCTVHAYSRSIGVPLYLDATGGVPRFADTLACSYRDVEGGADEPELAFDFTLPIALAH